MTRFFQTTFLAACLLATTLLLGGCSSTITSSDLRADPNPELFSASRSSETYFNNRALVRNNTWRQINDDWSTIWLESRNQRLTRFTLP